MSRRERLREITREEIKTLARQQMEEGGTASLSLGAIARAMELTPPALYRYYASRDDLITALIVDAYDDLATALQATSHAASGAPYADRLYAVLLCYRDWALAHPVDFQLIFGNPIPGYQAPADQSTPAARRVGAVILELLIAAHRAGKLHIPTDQQAVPPLFHDHMLGDMGDASAADKTILAYFYLAGWARIHGLIMLELFNHIQPLITDTGAFYRYEVISFLRIVGLEPPNTS